MDGFRSAQRWQRFDSACAIHDLQLDALGAGDLAEALFRFVQKLDGATGSVSKRVSPDSTRASVSKSSVRRDMRAGILADDFQKFAGRAGIFRNDVKQSLGISLNRGQRRPQFVGNVGDKVATGLFHALGFGEIAKHGDRAAIGQWGGGDIEGAARQRWKWRAACLLFFSSVADLTVARKSGSRIVSTMGACRRVCCGTRRSMGWLAHCTRPSELTAMTASCMLLSRVSSWRWLELHGREAAFDLLARSCRWRRRRGQFHRAEDRLRGLAGRLCSMRAATSTMCSRRREVQTETEPAISKATNRASRAPISRREPAPGQLQHRRVGRQDGLRHRKLERRHKEMECREWHCDVILSGLAGERSGEFLAGGMILHRRRMASESARTLPDGVDDGGAGSGGRPSCAAISASECVWSFSTR